MVPARDEARKSAETRAVEVKKLCRRAAIKPATFHALHHNFGTHLRMAGVNLADIADLMGHKDLATTQIYAQGAAGALAIRRWEAESLGSCDGTGLAGSSDADE